MAAAALSGTRLASVIGAARVYEPADDPYLYHPAARVDHVLGLLGALGVLTPDRPGATRRQARTVLAALADTEALRALSRMSDGSLLALLATGGGPGILRAYGLPRLLGRELSAAVAAIYRRVSRPGRRASARTPRPRAARRTRSAASRDGPASDPSPSRPPRRDLAAGAAA